MSALFATRLAVLPLLALALHTQAQGLSDPTRPPPSILAGRAVLSGQGPVAATPTGPQLQSVLIARHPGGRHLAVIDGQTVKLGDTFRGAVVSRMTESEVVLVTGNSRQVLKLFPGPALPK